MLTNSACMQRRGTGKTDGGGNGRRWRGPSTGMVDAEWRLAEKTLPKTRQIILAVHPSPSSPAAAAVAVAVTSRAIGHALAWEIFRSDGIMGLLSADMTSWAATWALSSIIIMDIIEHAADGGGDDGHDRLGVSDGP